MMSHKEIYCKEHNILRLLLTKQEILELESITVTGSISRSDFDLLGLMCRDYSLIEIDLSKSRLIYPNTIYMQFGNSKLNKILLPDLLKKINLNAFDNSQLATIEIPKTVNEICQHSFSDTQIEEIEIPCSLIRISTKSFTNSPLKKIVVNSVQEIENNAFKGCDFLKEIHIKSVSPPYLHYQSFEESHFENCTVFVPIGYKDVYEKADYWIKFKHIDEINFNPPKDAIKNDSITDSIKKKHSKKNRQLFMGCFGYTLFFSFILFLLFRACS